MRWRPPRSAVPPALELLPASALRTSGFNPGLYLLAPPPRGAAKPHGTGEPAASLELVDVANRNPEEGSDLGGSEKERLGWSGYLDFHTRESKPLWKGDNAEGHKRRDEGA